jgi:uncharacterized membrane protein
MIVVFVGVFAAAALAARLILLATVPRMVFLLFNGIYLGIINVTDNKVFVRDANDAPHTTALADKYESTDNPISTSSICGARDGG